MAVATPTRTDQTDTDAQAVTYARKLLERAQRGRDKFERDCERAHDVYKGLLNRRNESASWQSQLHPGYGWQKVETLFANLLDEAPVGRVSADEPQGVEGAKKMECLLAKQRRRDARDQKLARFIKQGLVLPMSTAKRHWRYEERDTTKYRYQPSIRGGTDRVPTPVRKPVWNQPSLHVFDPRDFFWDPAAQAGVEDMSWAADRTWTTIEHLKDWEAQGLYRNVDQVPENTRGVQPQPASGRRWEEQQHGRIEVVDFFIRQPRGVRRLTLANRSVVLADDASPYDYPVDLPYVVWVALPDTEGLPGFSVAERIAELQEAYWSLLNQYMDATRFIGNPILIGNIDKDTEYKAAPGAVWKTLDPESIKPWHPPVEVLSPLLQAMQQIRQEMDDITGVNQYVSGVGGEQVDPKTATEFAGYQNAAQRRVITMKTSLNAELHRDGLMEIALNQQFIDTPQLAPSQQKPLADPSTPGETIPQFETVMPEDLACEMGYDVEDAAQSIDKQKRRDEALNLSSQLLAWAPVAVQTGQQPPSVAAVFEMLGDAFDRKDWNDWLAAPPQPAPQLAFGSPGGAPQNASPVAAPNPQGSAAPGRPSFRPAQPAAA